MDIIKEFLHYKCSLWKKKTAHFEFYCNTNIYPLNKYRYKYYLPTIHASIHKEAIDYISDGRSCSQDNLNRDTSQRWDLWKQLRKKISNYQQ